MHARPYGTLCVVHSGSLGTNRPGVEFCVGMMNGSRSTISNSGSVLSTSRIAAAWPSGTRSTPMVGITVESQSTSTPSAE